METPPPFDGKRPVRVTAAELVILLEQAIDVMRVRVERHERKAGKAKADRDEQFHLKVAAGGRSWLDQAVPLVEYLKAEIASGRAFRLLI